MLARFSLYGFLKNQRYFEPFLYLALMEKGMSFSQIGLLVGLRELLVNLLGVPMGAVADVLGRRRALIFAFGVYVVSFLVLGVVVSFWALAGGMALFAVGESFRSGTHKAMIFDWLAREGRQSEKTRVYGYTRSWSKRGSAVSVIVATGLVLLTGRYTDVFLWCALPYALGVLNILAYPKFLDGGRPDGPALRGVLATLWDGMRDVVGNRPLRRLLVESTAFEGTFKVVKGYLQPLLESIALAAPVLIAWSDRRRTAVVVGAVYVVLHVLGSRASRGADGFARRAGSPDRAAGRLWLAYLAVFAAMALLLSVDLAAPAAAGFVLLAVLQDTWRPILITRIDDECPPDRQATILSIESQGQSMFSAVAAPLIGLAVDALAGNVRFLPVALLGALVAAAILGIRRASPAGPLPPASPDRAH